LIPRRDRSSCAVREAAAREEARKAAETAAAEKLAPTEQTSVNLQAQLAASETARLTSETAKAAAQQKGIALQLELERK
jgi:hypothetical protein